MSLRVAAARRNHPPPNALWLRDNLVAKSIAYGSDGIEGGERARVVKSNADVWTIRSNNRFFRFSS